MFSKINYILCPPPRLTSGKLLESATPPGGAMKLRYETLDLTLAMPFTISRGTQLTSENVKVELGDATTTGIGEAAPSEHYGELQGTVCAFLDALSATLDGSSLPISVLHEEMNRIAHLNPAAKAAVDMAAYDL